MPNEIAEAAQKKDGDSDERACVTRRQRPTGVTARAIAQRRHRDDDRTREHGCVERGVVRREKTLDADVQMRPAIPQESGRKPQADQPDRKIELRAPRRKY